MEVTITDYQAGRTLTVSLAPMTAAGAGQLGQPATITLGNQCTTSALSLQAGCDLTQPFGTPTVISDLPLGAEGIRLSADELTAIYLVRGTGNFDLYRSTRESVALPFGHPTPWSELNSPGLEALPTVPSTNRTVYFERADESGSHVDTASASSAWGTFSSPSALTLGSSLGEGGPYVTPNGKSLYFHVDSGSSLDLYRADPDPGSGDRGVPIPGLNTDADESDPIVTPDELTIVFASNRPDPSAGGATDIWIATRASRGDDFGPPRDLQELNTAGDEGPTWISPDGCRLYFDRGLASYIAARPR